MANQEEVIVIDSDDLEPEPAADIVINAEDLPKDAPSRATVEAEVVDVEVPDVPCAVCLNPIEPGQNFGFCSVCNTPYHKECWDYNKGCAVLQCPGGKNVRAFRPGTSL